MYIIQPSAPKGGRALLIVLIVLIVLRKANPLKPPVCAVCGIDTAAGIRHLHPISQTSSKQSRSIRNAKSGVPDHSAFDSDDWAAG